MICLAESFVCCAISVAGVRAFVARMRSIALSFSSILIGFSPDIKICFYTQEFTEEKEKSILSWCETNSNVLYYAKKIAPWTFEIEFETKDYKELNAILKELRNKFGDVIKRTETTLITEEMKGEMNFLN